MAHSGKKVRPTKARSGGALRANVEGESGLWRGKTGTGSLARNLLPTGVKVATITGDPRDLCCHSAVYSISQDGSGVLGCVRLLE